jgi:hypothetical protein
VEEAVQRGLGELVDDDVVRRPGPAEDGRAERGRPGDHRHRRASRQVLVDVERPAARLAEDADRPVEVDDAGLPGCGPGPVQPGITEGSA